MSQKCESTAIPQCGDSETMCTLLFLCNQCDDTVRKPPTNLKQRHWMDPLKPSQESWRKDRKRGENYWEIQGHCETQDEVNSKTMEKAERRKAESTGQHEWASLKVDMKADEPRQPPLTALTKPNGTAGSKRPRHPLSDCCPAQPNRLMVSVAAAQLSYSMVSLFLCLISTGLNQNDW